ncbi:polysaccharide biosynthesis protein [Ectobacillus sp. sgz5001026]|uniref:polysaccharide biosynthesis protein n=1 Tax=Ectobacillus sp. sgz5001026 TaxID=3242473 RepID=UPI0036D3D8D1
MLLCKKPIHNDVQLIIIHTGITSYFIIMSEVAKLVPKIGTLEKGVEIFALAVRESAKIN